MEETIEKLKIEIISDTTNASTDIKKLASSFKMLKSATSNISNLKSTYNILRKIDSLSFKNPIKGLNSLVKAFNVIKNKKLSHPLVEEKKPDLKTNSGSEKMPNLKLESNSTSKDLVSNSIIDLGKKFEIDSKTIDGMLAGKAVAYDLLKSFQANNEEIERERQLISSLSEQINLLPKVRNIFGEDALSDDARKLIVLQDKLTTVVNEKEKVSGNITSILSNLNNAFLIKDTTEVAAQVRALGKELEKLKGKNIEFDKISNSSNKMTKVMNKGTHKVLKFVKSLGRIALYRAIRSVLKSITEGFQDLAKFDSRFNESMSEIKSDILYIRNSIIAMVAPIIEVLTPVFTTLTNVVVECINKISLLFNVLAGNNTYTQATKTVEDYANALKKANSQTSGFDEINVLQDNNSSSEGMFSTVEIDTEQIDEAIALATTLSAILVGLTVVKTLGGVAKLIKMFDVLKSGLTLMGPILLMIIGGFTTIYGFIDGIVNGFNWQNVLIILGGIALLCIGIGLSIGWIPALIVAIIAVVALLVAVIIQYWDEIKAFFIKIWSAISDFFVGIWENVVAVWNNVTSWFVNLFTSAWNGIKNAWSAVTNFFSNIWNGIKSGFIGAINGIIGGFENFINFFVKGINTIIRGINSISLDIPDWLGGGHIGFNIGYISEVRLGRVSGYASGGFPNSGELYMARENGISEMIGRFGSRATVANNDQIIEGIKRGVYEAMIESKNNEDSESIIIQIIDHNRRIQSERIISTAERRNRRDGKKIIAVGI